MTAAGWEVAPFESAKVEQLELPTPLARVPAMAAHWEASRRSSSHRARLTLRWLSDGQDIVAYDGVDEASALQLLSDLGRVETDAVDTVESALVAEAEVDSAAARAARPPSCVRVVGHTYSLREQMNSYFVRNNCGSWQYVSVDLAGLWSNTACANLAPGELVQFMKRAPWSIRHNGMSYCH
jgi:hypothetical protein